MKIIKSDMDDAFIGTCANCKKKGVKVRRVEVRGMFNEPRGYVNICFECYAEQIYFKGRNGIICHTPKRERKSKEEEATP